MAHAQLISYSYTRGSDALFVQAIVDDAVQVLPATHLDPPEFDSAHCQAVILWDEPLDHTNAPTRESTNGVECIEAIKAAMTFDEFIGYLRGNCIKYTWRYRQKNGVEDLRKAKWYLCRLISEFELNPYDDPLA